MPQDAPTPQDTPTPAPGPEPSTGADHDGQVAHGGHGTSTAAWISTLGVTFGALVVCVAMIFQWVPVIVVGAVIIVVFALSAPVLIRAGFGEDSGTTEYTGEKRAVR